MKVKNISKHTSVFQPITLEITLETIGEARALYCIMNHTRNAGVLGETAANHIMEHIEDNLMDQGISTSELEEDVINNGVKKDDFYRP